MAKPKEKQKFSLWLHPETFQMIESNYQNDNCKTKSEFIEKAIQFYTGYLNADEYSGYYPNVIVSTIKGSLDSLENRMARLLYKNTVELAMMMHVTAANFRVDEGTLSRLRSKCAADVKKTNGHITFDEAVKYQKGD